MSSRGKGKRPASLPPRLDEVTDDVLDRADSLSSDEVASPLGREGLLKYNMRGETTMRALLIVQAFPPLLKNAGGVAKRYLTLCGALIDGLGWKVTLVTPVNVLRSGDKDVERWLHEGSLIHIPGRGVRALTKDGVGVFLDLFSWVNTFWLLHVLLQHNGYDVCIADDVPWRLNLLLLMRTFSVPTIVTSHTDATRLESSKSLSFKMVWRVHMASAKFAEVHASVSRVFGKILVEREGAPVNAIWPPILWSTEFRVDRPAYAAEAEALRADWVAGVQKEHGYTPRAILLFAGRWAREKRIDLLMNAVPEGSALVIVGDGTSEFSEEVADAAASHKGVLPRRAMLNAHQLRIAYQACDVFVSASDFETLGNTVVESLCSGTPVAVQPAQGHMEFVVDGKNSYFVDYDDAAGARATLTRIVDEGLAHPDGFPGVLPDLLSIGRRFRESNFAAEYEKGVLLPALRIARDRRSTECRGFGEIFIRPLCALGWLLMWIILRVFTRTVFFCSRFPKFEILGTLGGSLETRGDHEKPDITSVEGHFRPARRLSDIDSERAARKSGGEKNKKRNGGGGGRGRGRDRGGGRSNRNRTRSLSEDGMVAS